MNELATSNLRGTCISQHGNSVAAVGPCSAQLAGSYEEQSGKQRTG